MQLKTSKNKNMEAEGSEKDKPNPVLSLITAVLNRARKLFSPNISVFSYIFLSSVMMLSIFGATLYLESIYHVVSVDGREIGVVDSKAEILEYIEELKETCRARKGMEVELQEQVSFEQEVRFGEDENPGAVRQKLESLSFKSVAYSVEVNGEPLMLVKNRESLNKALKDLKEEYSGSGNLEHVDIREDINLIKTKAEPGEVKSAEEASQKLLGGKDRKEVHRISRGDTLSRISRQYEVPEEEINQANPGVDEYNLREGEELELVYEEPLLTVETVEKVKEKESVPFPVETVTSSDMLAMQREIKQSGEQGVKEVKYEVKYENGREVHRKKIAESVLEEPRKQVEKTGTATHPSQSKGPFKWPVEGGGRITQPFGGAHRGVDIASSRGTPILAAYDGVVSSVREHFGSAGHVVTLRHNIEASTYYTVYMHNDVNLVSEGEKVSRGQTIARMGDTGRATGVHLHFEIRKGLDNRNASVDPLNYFSP